MLSAKHQRNFFCYIALECKQACSSPLSGCCCILRNTPFWRWLHNLLTTTTSEHTVRHIVLILCPINSPTVHNMVLTICAVSFLSLLAIKDCNDMWMTWMLFVVEAVASLPTWNPICDFGMVVHTGKWFFFCWPAPIRTIPSALLALAHSTHWHDLPQRMPYKLPSSLWAIQMRSTFRYSGANICLEELECVAHARPWIAKPTDLVEDNRNWLKPSSRQTNSALWVWKLAPSKSNLKRMWWPSKES